MEKIMTNEDYFKSLDIRINRLCMLRREAISISNGIIGNTLCSEDLFFIASTDRCIRLIDGFIPMLKERNLTCAGVLLRIQMDNCMRTYAAFIAEDQNAVVQCVLNGDSIRKHVDKSGHKMNDSYLKNKLTEVDKIFGTVYDNASGYIHLSEKAFYQTLAKCEENHFEFMVGISPLEKSNKILIEAAEAYIHFVELHFKLLQEVVKSKQAFEARIANTEHKG